MHKLIVLLIFSVLAVTQLNGCAGLDSSQNSTPAQQADASCPFFSKKMMTGAIMGGVIGGAAAATTSSKKSRSDILTGVILGSITGGAIGKTLDAKDCDAAKYAMNRMANDRVTRPVEWNNPESGNKGTFIAKGAPVQSSSGQLCRPYHQTVVLKDGTSTEQDGTTCRHQNGDWYPLG